MTAAKMKPIALRTHEARELAEKGEVTIRRGMNPYPEVYQGESGLQFEHDGWHGSLGVDRYVRECCPFGRVGEQRWVREPWALVSADEDGIDDWVDRGPIPASLPWPGWRVWHRGGHSWAYDHPDDRGFRWRSPVAMPRWASRFDVEIASVAIEADPWTWVVTLRRLEVS